MGYDLHIVRTEDWTQAASAPITRQEVDSLIAGDSELAWSTTSYVDMADDAGAVARYYAINWRGEPCFLWYRDQIECSGPDEAQTAKLVQMAQALGAHVVGDDGEMYPLEEEQESDLKPTTLHDLATRPAPAIRRTPTPWPLWKRLIAAFLLGCVLLALKLLIFGP